jgi:hypothetical protein
VAWRFPCPHHRTLRAASRGPRTFHHPHEHAHPSAPRTSGTSQGTGATEQGSAGTHHYLRRTLCTRVRAAGPLHVDAGDLRPWFPVKLLCAPAPHSVVRFQVQPFLFLFSLNLAAIFGGKRAPVANRPSPFPSALIKRGDSWHPLPRVELMTLFSCGAEIQWETIVFPRIGASSREFNHGEAQTNGATRKRFRQRPCVM